MVTKKGRPRIGEEPQKPRIHFGFSIKFEDKHVIDKFKKNCAIMGEPVCKVLLKKISDANKLFADAFISEEELEVESVEEIPEQTMQEGVLENGTDSKEISELSESDESEEEEESEEVEEENIQEEIEEINNVES